MQEQESWKTVDMKDSVDVVMSRKDRSWM